MRYSWIITILLFVLLSGGWAADTQPWSFRFGVGSLFPDASEIIDPNSPNGLNISASMAYLYRSRLVFQGTTHFDYFSDDKRLDFRTYIIIFNAVIEAKIHPLRTS